MPLSRDQFATMKARLYFADPSAPAPAGVDHRVRRLWKIDWLLHSFNERCRLFWELGNVAALDEMMVKCLSRFVSIRIRQPNKPIRFGYKLYAICDASSGFLSSFLTHDWTKADRKDNAIMSRRPYIASTVTAMLHFIRSSGLLDAGASRLFCFDNWFTSAKLMMALRRAGQWAVGTVKAVRGLPTELINLEVPSVRGAMNFRRSVDGELLFQVWQDSVFSPRTGLG